MSQHIENIYIDSSDSILASGVHNEVIIQLDSPVKANRIRIAHMEIGNTIYNVTNRNNAVNLDGSLVNITPGNYNMTDLLNQIESEFNSSNSDTFDISFSDSSSKITIVDSTKNCTLDFDVDNSLADLIGFDRNSTYTGSDTYIGSFPADLNAPIFVYIDSVSSNFVTSDDKRMSFYIPNTEARNNTIYYNENEEFAQSCNAYGSTFKQMRIRIEDKFGSLHNNVGPWRMVLRIEH